MSILIVNPQDEISHYSHDNGLIVRYMYSGVKVKGIQFSVEVVNTWAVYNSDNAMISKVNNKNITSIDN